MTTASETLATTSSSPAADPHAEPTPVTLSLAGFRRGCQASMPLVPGILIFGMLCGVVARQSGLTFLENLLMNTVVFSGAAQLASMDQWGYPIPILAIVITTLLINMRFLLLGVSVQPWLRSIDPRIVYPNLWVITDQGWTMGMVGYQRGERDAGYFFGANVLIWPVWVFAAAIGYVAGTGIGDPARIGVDFSVTVIFAANLVSAWRGRRDLIPWLAAAIAALIAAWLIPGNWYILIGGITGFIAGVAKTPPSVNATSRAIATEDSR